MLKLSEMILEAHKSGGRIFLCGNGGSAANAMHIANDLVYAVAEKTGAGIDAISLSANTALLTCLGNDVGYENIYSEQLAVSGRAGDILIVFSGSGNSQNILMLSIRLSHEECEQRLSLDMMAGCANKLLNCHPLSILRICRLQKTFN